MAYSNHKSDDKVNLIIKIIYKLSKLVVKIFPLNSVRKLAIVLCGYKVGKKVYIGEEFLIINAVSEKSTFLKIGDRASIAPRVTVVLASDANWSYLTKYIEPIRGGVILKEDCWIGTGSIILPNVTIGKCSIVAAGAVVTQDVEDYTVVAGVPAQTVKKIEL